ncbi:hypothetical protein VNI00_007904 [Paramarasmius palmivorus]|uniref:Uncharacterized protein n=1 Tax=Paramarasmius palmivorus TaxID=297713 RepID=A0AAW0CVH9_9AGAR
MKFTLYLCHLGLGTLVAGRRITRIIDDELGDEVTGVKPIYSGDGWALGSTCTGCPELDPSQTQNGTWHYNYRKANESSIGINITFTGVAVSAWTIRPDKIPGIAGEDLQYAVDVYLDDQVATGLYGPPVNEGNTFSYRHQMYSNSSLSNTTHVLQMRNNQGQDTIFFFDFVQYVFDDGLPDEENSVNTPTVASSTKSDSTDRPTSSTTTSGGNNDNPKGSNHIATIVGAAVGSIGLAAAGISITLFVLRRRSLRQIPVHTQTHPYMVQILSPSRKGERQSRGFSDEGTSVDTESTYDTSSTSELVARAQEDYVLPPPSYRSLFRGFSAREAYNGRRMSRT